MWGGDEGNGYAHRSEGGEGPRSGESRAAGDAEAGEDRGGVRGAETAVLLWMEWEDRRDMDGARHCQALCQALMGSGWQRLCPGNLGSSGCCQALGLKTAAHYICVCTNRLTNKYNN